MLKKIKVLLLIFVFGFSCYNPSFVALSQTKYPDYACTYCGMDKLEKFNRKMFSFNLKFNKYVLKPLNVVWASIMPKYGMDRIKNVYTNIEYPKRVVSSLIQRDMKTAGNESKRFIINTTIGLGGMFDPAKSKFKLESSRMDMDKALANCKIPSGPYLVLPFLPPSNVRGYFGKLFDYALTPSTYTFGFGFIPSIAKACCTVNTTTYAQPLISTLNGTFYDPYDIAKKAYGLDNYLKNTQDGAKEVFAEVLDEKNNKEINNSQNSISLVKPDMTFTDYESQGPIIDSLRTSYFSSPDIKKSAWSEVSIWNRCFCKKFKSDFVNIADGRPKYRFNYLLQKNKEAPLAIFYPSTGEGAASPHAFVFAKMLYDKGYSVAIQGSAWHWEFVKSCPQGYRPGIPLKDAEYARILSQRIVKRLEEKEQIKPMEKLIAGTSFGGVTALFVGAEEQKNDTLGVSKYIAISPPVELYYAFSVLDKNSLAWNQNQDELKERTAAVANKIYNLAKLLNDEDPSNDPKILPFSDDEGKFAIDFIMKQKLSDVVMALESPSETQMSEFYKTVNDMNFSDYVDKYLSPSFNGDKEKLSSAMSMSNINDFLATSDKYKIYVAIDDFYLTSNHVSWLKEIGKNKVVVLPNGSHLGFLYRDEFKASFKDDIALDKKFESADVVVKEESLPLENKS